MRFRKSRALADDKVFHYEEFESSLFIRVHLRKHRCQGKNPERTEKVQVIQRFEHPSKADLQWEKFLKNRGVAVQWRPPITPISATLPNCFKFVLHYHDNRSRAEAVQGSEGMLNQHKGDALASDVGTNEVL